MKIKIFTLILILFLVVIVQAGRWYHLGLAGYQVLSIEEDPADSQYIYAGTDYGLLVSDNGGQLWFSIIPTNVQIPYIAYDPFNPDTLLRLISGGSNSDGFYYSTSHGFSWEVICYLLNPRRVAFDPIDTGYIYICLSDGILTSQNRGQTLAPANNGLPNTDILDVLGDGRHELEAYAVGSTFVAHTTNFGNNWAVVGDSFAFENYNPQRIIHDPIHSETLYVSCYSHVAVSTDGGVDWSYTPMNGTGYRPLESDPQVTGRVFVGSIDGGGVFESTDGGASFAAINDSLGNLNVYSLKFNSTGKLLAGTANGIYIYDFSVGIEGQQINRPQAYTLKQNYPNPFNGQTTIEFSVLDNEPVRLLLYDVAGRLVRQLYSGKGEGTMSVIWDGKNDKSAPSASGVYFYRLETPAGDVIRRLSFLK